MLLINKPVGWTSFDVVNKIRNNEIRKLRNNGIKKPNIKVGHAGTLDPFATGLLIIGVGREETKRLDEFKKLTKTYIATLHLGAMSDTYDRTGRIDELRIKNYESSPNNNETMEPRNERDFAVAQQLNNELVIDRTQIESVLNSFKGKQLQIPPMFSAKKVGGERLYKLARQGKEIKRQPVEIEILDIKILEYSFPYLKIETSCTSGTYIRSLAHDIGQKLGVGAYCEELARTRIGNYRIEDAISIESYVKNLTFNIHSVSLDTSLATMV